MSFRNLPPFFLRLLPCKAIDSPCQTAFPRRVRDEFLCFLLLRQLSRRLCRLFPLRLRLKNRFSRRYLLRLLQPVQSALLLLFELIFALGTGLLCLSRVQFLFSLQLDCFRLLCFSSLLLSLTAPIRWLWLFHRRLCPVFGSPLL